MSTSPVASLTSHHWQLLDISGYKTAFRRVDSMLHMLYHPSHGQATAWPKPDPSCHLSRVLPGKPTFNFNNSCWRMIFWVSRWDPIEMTQVGTRTHCSSLRFSGSTLDAWKTRPWLQEKWNSMHHIDVYRTEVGQKWTCKWFLFLHIFGAFEIPVPEYTKDIRQGHHLGTTRPSMITEALMLRVQCPANGFPTKMVSCKSPIIIKKKK